MKRSHLILLGTGLGLLLFGLGPTACPRPVPPGETPKPTLISCGARVIAECIPQVAPRVLSCLDGSGDVTSCLWAIPAVVSCAGYEAIACATRHEGSIAEHAAQAERSTKLGLVGPEGGGLSRRAERAREFLSRTGAQFTE